MTWEILKGITITLWIASAACCLAGIVVCCDHGNDATAPSWAIPWFLVSIIFALWGYVTFKINMVLMSEAARIEIALKARKDALEGMNQ